jgi:hypothetical protein
MINGIRGGILAVIATILFIEMQRCKPHLLTMVEQLGVIQAE